MRRCVVSALHIPAVIVSTEQSLADIISNIVLVVIPLYLLWHSSLPKGPRYTISAVFATTILTTSVCVVHAIYETSTNEILDGETAHLEVRPPPSTLITISCVTEASITQSATTVLVCNLLVLVTYVYRRISNGRDSDDESTDDYTTDAHGPRDRHRITFIGSFTGISSHTQTQSQATHSTSLPRRGSSLFLDASFLRNAAGAGDGAPLPTESMKSDGDGSLAGPAKTPSQ